MYLLWRDNMGGQMETQKKLEKNEPCRTLDFERDRGTAELV